MEHRTDEDPRPHEVERSERVTVVHDSGERRGSGGVIVALIALVVVALVAFWAIGRGGEVDPSDASVAAAADKVGAAADQVGEAAQDAVDQVR